MNRKMGRLLTNEDIFHAMSCDPPLEVVDRRRSVRLAHATVAVVVPDAPCLTASQLQVMVIDISRDGVGFRSPASFEAGSIHRMRIGTGPLHIESRLRIACCRERPDGLFDIGGEFV